jgi:hypothetical protein
MTRQELAAATAAELGREAAHFRAAAGRSA